MSLDVFRGFTMFLLIAEGTGLFPALSDEQFRGTVVGFIGEQLHHHEWHGLRFWDLVQPFFMFIVGVALPFAVRARLEKGDPWRAITLHVLKRSLVLLLLGWGLYCIGPGRITFRFQNVLAQLSVTYLIAYLLLNRKWWTQLGASIALLIATEIIYRTFWAAGYDRPFEPDRNFGAWVDQMIAGELSGGHWVSFNAIPTAAHTIWGVLAGQLLMSGRPWQRKVAIFAGCGAAAVLAGYGLDLVTPVIKRIATTSFVVMSGGWCLIGLAICYWLVDVVKVRIWPTFFTIVGMNSLLIYLFSELDGDDILHSIAKPFVDAAFSWTGEVYLRMITGVVVWAMLWGLCYWLYRRRIFIKI
jgi:predicted acyltransferase